MAAQGTRSGGLELVTGSVSPIQTTQSPDTFITRRQQSPASSDKGTAAAAKSTPRGTGSSNSVGTRGISTASHNDPDYVGVDGDDLVDTDDSSVDEVDE